MDPVEERIVLCGLCFEIIKPGEDVFSQGGNHWHRRCWTTERVGRMDSKERELRFEELKGKRSTVNPIPLDPSDPHSSSSKEPLSLDEMEEWEALKKFLGCS